MSSVRARSRSSESPALGEIKGGKATKSIEDFYAFPVGLVARDLF